MSRSKRLAHYALRYYETCKTAGRLGELRLEFDHRNKARSESLNYYGFRNAVYLHLEQTPAHQQSRLAQEVAIFLPDLEFPVEGTDLLIRKTTRNEAEIAATRALEAARLRQGFSESFGHLQPDVADPSAPTSQEDLMRPAEPDNALETAREKLAKWIDPTEQVLRDLGIIDKDKK